MEDFNRYITSSAVAEEGGMIMLQEAGIRFGEGKGRKRSQAGSEMPVILALVFSERGEAQRELSVEIGEWFQNELVQRVRDDGENSLIYACIEGIGRTGCYERINRLEYACLLVAGHSCALFMNGETPGMYTIEELLGKTMMLPMKVNRDGIMVELVEGGAIIISDKALAGDGFYARELAAGISGAADEKSLERLLREIVNIEESGCKAIVGVKVMD